MQQEYSYELKIPKSRLGVLIGTKGMVKREIEEATHTKLKVDSLEGDIRIRGKDTLGLYTAREVVKAIGRGFNPDIARLLLKQDYALEIISISAATGKSKNKLLRMKGRAIGAEGKSRKTIEQLTDTNISIFGKTISIIGRSENVILALKAMERLLSGAKHANIYAWLEKKQRELFKRGIEEAELIRAMKTEEKHL